MSFQYPDDWKLTTSADDHGVANADATATAPDGATVAFHHDVSGTQCAPKAAADPQAPRVKDVTPLPNQPELFVVSFASPNGTLLGASVTSAHVDVADLNRQLSLGCHPDLLFPDPAASSKQDSLALTTLASTKMLGQNTPAIASTEAHYEETWAQDVTAMSGYL